MKKLALYSAALVSAALVAAPIISVNARRGADDSADHIRQEDRHENDLQINSPTPTQPEQESESSETGEDAATTNIISTITQEEAKAIADTVYPDKTIREVELEQEHGLMVWEIKFTDGSRLDIDAETGAITRNIDTVNPGIDGEDPDNSGNEDHRGRGSDNSGHEHHDDDSNDD